MLIALMLIFSAPHSHAYANVTSFQDGEDGDDAPIKFNPFTYTVTRHGKPYLRVTVQAVGKIDAELDSVPYHNKKPLFESVMLNILAQLSKKKFRVGRRLDPDLIQKYFQAAINRKLKKKNAVKIYIIQASQVPL